MVERHDGYESNDAEGVTLVSVEIPFGDMVVLAIKWSLAFVIAAVAIVAVGGLFYAAYLVTK